MQTKVEKLPKASLKLTVTVEADKVKETYEKVLDAAVLKTQIDGFRLGNAPREAVREKVGVSTLYGEVINKLLQTYYTQAVKENHIIPVANPRVEIKEFEIEKEFIFTATVPVKPEVKMGDYKKALKKRYEEREELKKKENEEKLKKGEKVEDAHAHLGSNDIIDVLQKEAQVEVSEVLVEDETERMMTRLVDQAQAIGLSLDQYLKSQNKTSEQLKKEYSEIAERNLKAEFVLMHLVNEEKIIIEDSEIDSMINAVGDEATAKRLKEDPYERTYIKSILQKNKLLHSLIEEVEGENHEHHQHDKHEGESDVDTTDATPNK